MSLLQALNLPRLKNRPPPGTAAPAGGAADDPAPPPPVAQAGAAPAGGADLFAESKRMRGTIASRREQARATLAQIHKLQPALEQKLATVTGPEREHFAAQKAMVAKKEAEAVKAIEQADADLRALDNPATRREELVKILARQGAAGTRATETEITSPGLDPKVSKRNHDVTDTTTSYANGKATIEKVRDQQKVGLGGYTRTRSKDTEVTSASLTARSGEEKKTQVSLTGKATVETKKTAEVELADGRKAGVERTDAKEISAKGASHTQTTKTTNFDGSSTATTTKKGVERGDGKITATSSTSTTTTDQSGMAVKRDASASAGIVAGKDGIGAQAAVEKGRTVTTKAGRQAGVVGGLHANVVCNIGEPKGEPKMYPVTVTVSFGGSVTGSVGAGKQENSKASVGVALKGGMDRTMVQTRMLSEAELEGYVKALQAASKGSKVAATHKEFAIITAGASQGWDVARQMWQGGGDPLSRQSVDALKRSGDSVERSDAKTAGVAVDAKVGPVGVGYGVTDRKENSTKVTRNDKGGLDVDAKSAQTRSEQKSASVSMGAVSAKVGTVHTHKTSFGYSIQIDPKNDPDGKLLERLGRCKTQMDYEIFIQSAVGRITVVGRTQGKSDAQGTQVGVGVGGVELGIGTRQGVDEEATRDGKGKLVKKTVAGHAGAGGKLGPLADSVDEDAVAEVDEKGEASLTMTRTTHDNYGGRARDKKLEKFRKKLTGAGEDGPKSGALTGAARGEEDDSATHDVSGLQLSSKELRRLGGIAVRSLPSWMGYTRRYQEDDDWRKAGVAIARAKADPAVVAEELARFVGGDRVERLKTLELFVRGGHAPVKMGKAFEFPDAIRALRADYDSIVADSLPDRLNTLAEQNALKASEECKRLMAIADTVGAKIRACDDFSNRATKMEMLQRLEWRRQQLAEGAKGYGGVRHPENDPQLLQDKRDRLTRQVRDFGDEQRALGKQLGKLLGPSGRFGVANGDLLEAQPLIRQLEHLQQRWMSDYYMLKETMAKLGQKDWAPKDMMPDDALLESFRKAAR